MEQSTQGTTRSGTKIPISTKYELASHQDHIDGWVFSSEMIMPLKEFIRAESIRGVSDEVYGPLDIIPKDTVVAIDEVLSAILNKDSPFESVQIQDLPKCFELEEDKVSELMDIIYRLEGSIIKIGHMFGQQFDRLYMHASGVFIIGEVDDVVDKYQHSDVLDF